MNGFKYFSKFSFFLFFPLMACQANEQLSFGKSKSPSPMSHEQKLADIQSLKAFEKRNGSPSLVPSKPKRVVPKFVCDTEGRLNCETQKVIHRIDNRPETTFIENGKYKVDVFFTNDKNFPIKYERSERFVSISIDDEASLLKDIYENYLGGRVEYYSPEIINVSDSTVGISIYVSSGDELDVFLSEPRVLGIYHIGNNRFIPEGY